MFDKTEKKWAYVFIQPLHHEEVLTQSQFLSGVKLEWIHSFPFPTLVA